MLLVLYVHETTSYPHYYKVEIGNGLQVPEDMLTAECWSAHDKLGIHILRNNQIYSWSFIDYILPWEHVKYYCLFHWKKDFHNQLMVINTGWPNKCDNEYTPNNIPGCRTYRWLVKEDGFYLAVKNDPIVPSDFEFKAPWLKNGLNESINVK
ncbi:putative plant self-incompatibility S1 [Helianthus anomalus]